MAATSLHDDVCIRQSGTVGIKLSCSGYDSPTGAENLVVQAASELALNGMVEGQLVRAIIDRTFIDSDGVRWIIDYKTSRPATGEGSDEFMSREAERYRNQLQLYAALIKQLEPSRPLRTALYFPMFDGWIEQ